MLFMSGLDRKNFNDIQSVKAKIQELDDNFDLVMIQEHFTQSMVLLSQLLCWNYSKLASIQLKVFDPESKTKISPEVREKLKKYLEADYLLYDYFKAKFEQKIAEYGYEKMNVEEKIMQQMNEKVEKYCSLGTVIE
jgi:hypothetical protein